MGMSAARIIALALAGTLLTGCGFRPMYATQASGARGYIGPVTIDTIPGKSGFELQTELERLLSVEKADTHPRRLSITLNEQFARVALRIDEASNRADLILVASYTLYDESGKTLVKGQADSIASYEVPLASSFGEVAAENDARERAASLLAERIRAELALRLAK